MLSLYKQKKVIDATYLDFKMQLSVCEMLRLIGGMAYNHAFYLGLDHESMIKNNHAFWIISKIKLVINSNIVENDKISLSTWAHKPGVLKFERDTMIKNKNKICAKSLAEWCCLDSETRRPVRANTIAFPELKEYKKLSDSIKFVNPNIDVTKNDYIYTKTIRSCDIDINGHTNNLRYNQFAIDSFTVEELKNINIKEYEIYYVNECKEFDKIDIYRRKIDKQHFYIEGKIEDKTIFKVVIKI